MTSIKKLRVIEYIDMNIELKLVFMINNASISETS